MSATLTNNLVKDVDKKDIIELENKIERFKNGEIDEERFKLYRLTRGVYGQRQLGVQMFRIKLPYGHLTAEQLVRIADVSDKYATGNLHITTRQDIQLHHVKLENSPLIWTELAEKNVTAREACGNTVRNVTASPTAGIDPEEPFDVTPHAHATAHFFLRNPICQEMGRKIKPAFSSSEKDTAMTFMHDFGFIPKVDNGQRGFKVLVGGGLGAQAIFAHEAFHFLPEDEIIPFMEASLRIFDRYGEREKRHKARLKFLIKSLGLDHFKELVDQERKALKNQHHAIQELQFSGPKKYFEPNVKSAANTDKYRIWRNTNVFEQKQKGYYGVYIKVHLGDLSSERARYLSKIVKKYAADDIRLTINQNVLIKFVHEDHLAEVFTILDGFGFAEPGFDSIADVTACPGTDTCNLGVTNSTALAGQIENLIHNEYPDLIEENHIKIKISGCMNACGQHTIGNIGFHGSSIKKNNMIIPAMQVLLGGGIDPLGEPSLADKVIKVPTKRILEAIRVILDDFHAHSKEGEYFNHYYRRVNGKKYFYSLLKHLTDVTTITNTELMDWGEDSKYNQAIGVGECAGVILDMVGTIINDGKEKLELAQAAFDEAFFGDSMYYSYSTFVIGAKALLLNDDVKCNTHKKIISDFQERFVESGRINLSFDFEEKALSFNEKQPSGSFAKEYLKDAKAFLAAVIQFKSQDLVSNGSDKEVIESYYKA